MKRVVAPLLTTLLVGGLVIMAWGQVVIIPTIADEQVASFPPLAAVRQPLVLFAVVFVGCVQVGLVAGAVVLRRAARGVVFEPPSVRWMQILLGSTVAATVVSGCLLVFVTVTKIPSPSDGMEVVGLWFGSAALVALGIACCLVGLVMLRALGRGVALRAELDAVI